MRTTLMLAFAAASSLAAPIVHNDEPMPRAVLGIGPASVNLRALDAETGLLLATLRSHAVHASPGFLGEIGYFANAPLKR
jgi:hypothetical protein